MEEAESNFAPFEFLIRYLDEIAEKEENKEE
jgi:hypothetical protein